MGLAVICSVDVPLSRAALLLTLSSTDDLGNLLAGQTATVSVELSGLVPGESLDFLAATIEFDELQLGTPTLTAGPIVPDLTGFLLAELPGLADGNYDSFFADTGGSIEDNGVFFSFDVTSQTVGATTILFSFVASSGEDSVGEPLDAVEFGPALEVTVVPEPSSLCLILFGIIGICRYARHSGKVAR